MTVRFILAFSFWDLYFGGKIICTGNRARYCGRYCFQTVIRWIGIDSGKGNYRQPRVGHFAVYNVLREDDILGSLSVRRHQ